MLQQKIKHTFRQKTGRQAF